MLSRGIRFQDRAHIEISDTYSLTEKGLPKKKEIYICHAGPRSTSNISIAKNGKIKVDPKTKKPCVSIIARKTIMPDKKY